MEKNVLGHIAKGIREGDRVVWIVALLLVMLSMVAIFSSTSQLAMQLHKSRTDIFLTHLLLVGAGAIVIFIVSSIQSGKFFRAVSSAGFALSFVLLLCLVFRIHIGDVVKVPVLNGACRGIRVAGFTIQVYEVAKVAMVMYLAWAVENYDNGHFRLSDSLGTRWPKYFGWMKSSAAERWLYIFLPIFIVSGLTMIGSVGSAVLLFVVMFVTILLGGIRWRQLVGPGLVLTGGIVLVVGLHLLTNGQFMERLQTPAKRLKIEMPYLDPAVREQWKASIQRKNVDPESLKVGSPEFYEFLEKEKQPRAAEIAFVEGGRKIFGKGPGQSTQRYAVQVMYEDYIYSLMVEEYGIGMGWLIIILYMSLFGRGTLLVYLSKRRFTKAAVGGLVFLITIQAFFHILINCNIGIVSGQTLPLISHGRCSFLCFCLAFGIILSMSRKVNLQMKAEAARIQNEQTSQNESDN